jgi:general nucleoside transport system ATP-binding protein
VALGLRPTTAGAVSIGGTRMARPSPSAGIAAGAVGVPEDPRVAAVVAEMSVLEHMPLGGRPVRRRLFDIDWGDVRRWLGGLRSAKELEIAAAGRTVADLSGGNIQRVMLARALGEPSTLVVAAYPSRGLDVAMTRATQGLLLDARASGAGVLMVSEDLDELIALADRIAVMHDGHVVGVVDPAGTDRAEIGRMMTGGVAGPPPPREMEALA